METKTALSYTSTKIQTIDVLRIPHSQGICITSANDIIRVEASSNYCKIYFLSDRPMLVAKLLQWFEKQLPPQMFTRVHRSHLINNFFIEEVKAGRYNTILLTNGEIIVMSRRKKSLLMAGQIC